MWRFWIFVLSCSSLLCSCQQDFVGFEKSESGIYYRFHKIGESKKCADYGDYIKVNIAYLTLSDSVFFSAQRQFQIQKSHFKGSIDECFKKMAMGDSASFIINSNLFFEKTLNGSVPSFLSESSHFKILVEMLSFMSEEQFEKEKQAFLTWIEDFSKYERIKIDNYLSDSDRNFQLQKQGFYKVLLKEGKGKVVQKGDTVVINYEGQFLNGQKFDSTYKRDRAFEFIYGTEWQVIEGIEKALADMKEGEKSIIILPSELAFGSKGNSNQAIRPFTSLIYRLELKEIRR